MKSMNRVFLMGNLGSEPALVNSKNGKSYTRLNVATKRTYKDVEGVSHSFTDWHSVFVFGALAENCVRYLKKGSGVFVEGHLNYWQADGEKLTKMSVQAGRVQFLDPVQTQHLDIPQSEGNHNAVAHPA